MSNVITHLYPEIEKYISTAKMVNVATALISSFGVEFLNRIPNGCEVKIIAGVDLPTQIEVLKQLRTSFGDNARVYLSPDSFFHPKVYLFKMKNNSLVAFIGSGNFTSGGLKDNVELAYKVTNQEECHELLDWFEDLYSKSSEITDTFLNKYKPYTNKWQSVKSEQSKEMSQIQAECETICFNYNSIKKELVKLRKSSDYQNIVKEQKKIVKKIRNAIDYKNNFRDFDVDVFLSILPLGHIIPTYKQSLIKAVMSGEMQKLCQMLCNDSIPIEQRYRLAVSDYKVNGCGCNIITKILCVHKPKEYMLWNNVSKEFLECIDVSFERGTKEWDKYKQLCNIFQKLCKETDIDDFAVLDSLLLGAIEAINRDGK